MSGDVRERAIQAGARAIGEMSLAGYAIGIENVWARAVLDAEGVAYFDLIDALAWALDQLEGVEWHSDIDEDRDDEYRALLARLGGNT